MLLIMTVTLSLSLKTSKKILTNQQHFQRQLSFLFSFLFHRIHSNVQRLVFVSSWLSTRSNIAHAAIIFYHVADAVSRLFVLRRLGAKRTILPSIKQALKSNILGILYAWMKWENLNVG